MKLMGEAKPTLLFTSYFTINTSFLLLLEFFSLNQHRNHVQIFISLFYLAVAAILDRNPKPNSLRDHKLLDHGRNMITDVDSIDDHHEVECKKTNEFDGDRGCDRESGYEGDDEDDEDENLSGKIEEFIAGRKREWREEIIRERFLCFEARSF